MKKIRFILFPVFFNLLASAQDNSGNQWKLSLSHCTVAFSYLYQNENLFQLGPKFEFINPKHENISLIPSLQLVTRHVTYLNPTVLLRYYKPLDKNIAGMHLAGVLGVEYSHRQVMGRQYDVVSPEIGLGIDGNISYVVGYNFALNQLPSWAWKWRIGIRLMLF